ncbi:MAG TPA: hypothetical protein VG269_23740 [Tepidisphaeraceae bacterium]|jgi:hypothetical protein|nr:hypothetical protein [Tepidisphaeraceae bacterium]
MDDLTTSPRVPWAVSRACETTRLQGQLLARAYQRVFPQLRRPIVDCTMTRPAAHCRENTSTAARVAAGA